VSRLLAPRGAVRSALGLLALVGMGALAERSPPRALLSLDDLAAVRDVAELHGGPTSQFANEFDFEQQLLALVPSTRDGGSWRGSARPGRTMTRRRLDLRSLRPLLPASTRSRRMKLAGAFTAALTVTGTCWANKPQKAPGIISMTVDPEIHHLPVVDADDIRFVRLRRSQGLSSQRVTSIVQDDHAFLWFGTDYGIDRYDGYQFRVFMSQPDDRGSPLHITEPTLFVDRSGTLWVGSLYGLGRYDPDTESFAHYPLARDSVSGSSVHHISQDRAGTLWISTERGLYRLDPTSGKTTHYRHHNADEASLSSDDIRSSGEDREGTLWIATSEGLDEFDRERGRVTLHMPLPENRDFGFYEDSNGVFWVRYASGNGLAILNRATGHLTRYSFGREDLPGRPLTGVSSMLEDQEGTLWIGTFSDGLLKYDRAHQRFIRYRNDPKNPESLTENRITTLLEDRDKNIWVGFGATEPAFFPTRRASFEVLPFDSSNPDNLGEALVNAIYEDRAGILWMGTTGALVRLDRKAGHLTHVEVPGHGIASDVLSIVEDAAGALWIGTSGQGLYRRLPGNEQLTAFRHSDTDPASLSDDTVVRLLVDHAGTLWVGTMNGLARFNPDTQNFTTFRLSGGDESNSFADVVEDSRGALWLGGYLSGVLRFDPRSGVFTPTKQHSERVLLNRVLLDHAGSLWISTQDGLDHFDPASGLLTRYTEKDGLPSTAVNCILEDSLGGLWLGTSAGLSHFDRRRGIFTNYTQADGLPGLDFIGWHACFSSDSGEMFIGGFSGAVAFRPERLAATASYAPSVALTSFQLFGKPVTPGSESILKHAIDYTDQVTLTHEQNSFAFEFAALSFANPATNHYRYKLEGLDKDWQEVGSERRYATYTTLPPGEYRFRVQGATIRGPWGEPGAAVRIGIQPPWWRAKSFQAALGTLLCLVAWAAWRLRLNKVVRQIEARMAERTRIARELHDTLLQSFNGLLLRFRTVHVLFSNNPDEARRILESAIDQARQALTEGREAVQGLRSSTFETSDFAEAIRTLGEALASDPAYSGSVALTLNIGGTPRVLQPLVRDEIYRTASEALRNAYRHADANRIEVQLDYGEARFELRVRDDGKGIDPKLMGGQELKGHYGLSGMRERAREIGARFRIWSAPGSGTEIELRISGSVAYDTPPRARRWWLRRRVFAARTAQRS
jgi:ligand-binding sensor domain-containing protein/signal transduction histidine kinase